MADEVTTIAQAYALAQREIPLGEQMQPDGYVAYLLALSDAVAPIAAGEGPESDRAALIVSDCRLLLGDHDDS